MKSLKLLYILLFVTILLSSGCTDDSSLIAPQESETSAIQSSIEPNWMSLPESDVNQLKKNYRKTELITAEKGGKIKIKEEYEGGRHGKVKVESEIKFGKHAINEDTYFTMDLDVETGAFTFSPGMVFNENASLSVSLEGLDLDNVDISKINFVYVAPSGEKIELKYKKIKFDRKKGKLEVEKVQIPHFSRYGFTK